MWINSFEILKNVMVSWLLKVFYVAQLRESTWPCLKYFCGLNKGSYSSTFEILILKSCFVGNALDLLFSLKPFYSVKFFFFQKRLAIRNTFFFAPSKTWLRNFSPNSIRKLCNFIFSFSLNIHNLSYAA